MMMEAQKQTTILRLSVVILFLFLSVGAGFKPKALEEIPYYLQGYSYFPTIDPEKWQHLKTRQTEPNVSTWVLPFPLMHPTRNHDSVLLEYQGKQLLLNLLGRKNRFVQLMDLKSGEQWSVRTDPKRVDPDGFPLDNLNHVYSVLVESIQPNGAKTGKKEIWLPCGFNGDAVNHEISVRYARIIDLDSLTVRLGPQLPIAGGACVAQLLTILPDEPPMICTFGGTLGSHDTGTFLPYSSCYDRIRRRWWFPFGKMPLALDHGSISVIPPSTCSPEDPRRLLILNFRTESYGVQRTEMLGFDFPAEGWTVKELQNKRMKDPGVGWYIYHNVSYDDYHDVLNTPRDASGTVTMDHGRKILNFGGIHYPHGPGVRFSVVRSFDVCEKEWSIVGDLGVGAFALQTVASQELQLSITCGGQTQHQQSNSPWCITTRPPTGDGYLANRHADLALRNFPPGYFPGFKKGLPYNTSLMHKFNVMKRFLLKKKQPSFLLSTLN